MAKENFTLKRSHLLDHNLLLSSLSIPLAAFVTSLLGSWHCMVMCGPMMAYCSTQKKSFQFHLGRLLSYASLGALAGYLGKSAFQIQGLGTAASILIAASLIWSGLKQWFPQIQMPSQFHFPKIILLKSKISLSSNFLLGASTALLPCGWLYTFVLLASTTQSAVTGSLTLFFFWMGSVPALASVGLFIATPYFRLKNIAYKKVIGSILILCGFYTLLLHFIVLPHQAHKDTMTICQQNTR